ncbi:hypothetical protein MGU_02904 [Metarhizium guizhouense ARSEF 977]|uniref:Uncharacterized protein n=1 Tax=Metarhizium guizhouense (strain ARSEF 977) TaxID=1276136 RepID=A0A0B4I9A5_METGA|nr:hypothetical protein MGU_02904 [Metarhizium guizhouense ARSEF 977]
MKDVDAGPLGGILHFRSMLSEGEPPSVLLLCPAACSARRRDEIPKAGMEQLTSSSSFPTVTPHVTAAGPFRLPAQLPCQPAKADSLTISPPPNAASSALPLKEHNDDDDADSDGERLAASFARAPGTEGRDEVLCVLKAARSLDLDCRAEAMSPRARGRMPDLLSFEKEWSMGRVRGECPGVVEDAVEAYDDTARILLAC